MMKKKKVSWEDWRRPVAGGWGKPLAWFGNVDTKDTATVRRRRQYAAPHTIPAAAPTSPWLQLDYRTVFTLH
ncbi:hypothetical protein N7508_010207 [Penicillium antarcticum]|uniref:uncharacterized protein n=1 Tax=Penicillium antarcticum TaxID=416450 RepID=UPI0023A52159|nr:uncharacterized protein N7508_010207 [Penicillium antarcticum]KAJ5295386.1 hypothetical protein N7508_010207 [Penicillium antarcticum]